MVNISLLAILAVAFVIRMTAAILLDPPLLSDDAEYVQLAESLVESGTYSLNGVPTAYRPPGYPFFLASVFSLNGSSLLTVRILQAVIDTLTCLLVFLLASQHMSGRMPLAAAAVYAMFPLQILYTASLMGETLFTFLFMLSLVIVTEGEPDWRNLLSSGFIAGLAVLVRPSGLVLPVIILFIPAIVHRPPQDRFRFAAIFLAGMLMVAGPWIVRNRMEFGRMSLTSNTGVNFWIGNHEGANGSFAYPDGNPLTKIEDEFERSDEGFRSGTEFIAGHPAESILIAAKKSAHFFGIDYWVLMSHHDDPARKSAASMKETFADIPTASIVLTHLPVIAVCLLALYCFTALPKDERRHWISLMLLVGLWLGAHIVFFGSARLRFPLHPILIISAVYGLHLLRLPTRSSARQLAIRGIFGLLLFAGWTAEIWTLTH